LAISAIWAAAWQAHKRKTLPAARALTFGIVEELGEFLVALDPRQESGELRVLAKV
jgi:hypothetical protein